VSLSRLSLTFLSLEPLGGECGERVTAVLSQRAAVPLIPFMSISLESLATSFEDVRIAGDLHLGTEMMREAVARAGYEEAPRSGREQYVEER
jgi:hypothetical protein